MDIYDGDDIDLLMEESLEVQFSELNESEKRSKCCGAKLGKFSKLYKHYFNEEWTDEDYLVCVKCQKPDKELKDEI